MKKSILKYSFLSLSFLLLIGYGCKMNYSFSGASVSPDVKTISILTFRNNASLAPPTISQSLTEAIKNMFTSQTKLSIVPRDGDLNIEGEITNYMTAPTAIQSNDQAAYNRLTITINVRFRNEKDEKQNFETSFSRFVDYPSTQSLPSVQEQLIQQIDDQLVQDIFNKTMVNW